MSSGAMMPDRVPFVARLKYLSNIWGETTSSGRPGNTTSISLVVPVAVGVAGIAGVAGVVGVAGDVTALAVLVETGSGWIDAGVAAIRAGGGRGA